MSKQKFEYLKFWADENDQGFWFDLDGCITDTDYALIADAFYEGWELMQVVVINSTPVYYLRREIFHQDDMLKAVLLSSFNRE